MYDSIIVGGGIIGAACARALSMAGRRVLVIDGHGVASGTSAKCEGYILVSDKKPGPELEFAQRSVLLWARFAEEAVEELGDSFPSIEYERRGGIVVAADRGSARPLHDRTATQRAAGVAVQDLQPDELLQLEPHIRPDLPAAAFYHDDAQVQPVVATEALIASARRNGADVVVGSPVISGVRTVAGRLQGVRTRENTYRSDIVLVAAGPWSGQIAGLLGAPLPVEPRKGMVLVTASMQKRIFHNVYDADYFGSTQSDDGGLMTSTVIESTPTGNVLIGSSRERIGFDQTLRLRVLRDVAERAIRLYPFLREASVIRTYGGFRPFTPDHLPVIGADPRVEGLWHATGHEGSGIGLSLATAEAIVNLLAGDRRPNPFSPNREGLLWGAKVSQP